MKNPTEAQLNDPKWWDENAPEGATHYSHISGNFLMYDGHKWFRFDDEHVLHTHRVSHECFTTRPTTPAAPEWDDEGLPPVGCECEVLHNGRWTKCKVVAHGSDHGEPVAFVQTEFWSCIEMDKNLRPLRTAEQRQREKVIIKASQSIQSFDGISMRQSTSEELAVHLYDAGMLRKGDE